MPSVIIDPTNKGLIQETGSGLFLKGTQARTATSDGLTTGIISATGGFIVLVTSASANNIVKLPAPVVGQTFLIAVTDNGCELRTSGNAVGINGTTGAVELALAADSLNWCICTSDTNWVVAKAATATADSV